jgi:hypothetical protein
LTGDEGNLFSVVLVVFGGKEAMSVGVEGTLEMKMEVMEMELKEVHLKE